MNILLEGPPFSVVVQKTICPLQNWYAGRIPAPSEPEGTSSGTDRRIGFREEAECENKEKRDVAEGSEKEYSKQASWMEGNGKSKN